MAAVCNAACFQVQWLISQSLDSSVTIVHHSRFSVVADTLHCCTVILVAAATAGLSVVGRKKRGWWFFVLFSEEMCIQ